MASASTVENNEDLLTEILLRLPVKSLMRFRCVSKRWQSQISNPFFSRSHTLHHYTPFPSHLLDTNVHTTGHSSFITMPSSDNNVSHNPMITDFRFLNLPHSIFIIQSCNGLLLLRVGHYPNSVYYVCNPITKRFLALDLPTALGRDEAEVVYLSFEPLRSSHYKVILMRFEHETDTTSNWHIDMINVYSSNTGCWTDFGFFQPPLQLEGSFEFKGTYCNGVIYWHCNNEESMYCDVENQCFGTFPMPCDGQFELADVLYFGESGGRLHMILRQSDRTYFDIFELREDLSEWSARFRVDLDGLFGNYFVVMCFFRRVKVEDSMLVFLMRRQVMLYNLSDCTCKRLVDFNHSLSPLVKLLVDSPTVLQYSASLSYDGDSSAF